MKHSGVYEDCKNLLFYGYDESSGKSGAKYEVYLDSFGCDLQVCCHRGGRLSESIRVYLGGREVYRCEEGSDNEYVVDRHWKRLISELWHHELAKHLEESYAINGTLLELCRREATKNRKIMNKYCEICLSLAKKKGKLKKISERTCLYEFEKMVDGHVVKVYATEKTPSEKMGSEDSVELSFDKKFVFSFYFNSSEIGWIHDDKGDYTPGEWEKILEQLAEEI